MAENTDRRAVSLAGKVALVTGSAKRLGRAVAFRLAREGADLVIHHHSSKTEALEAVGEIEKLGRRAIAVSADLLKAHELRALFEAVEEKFGRLDILVNSAANFIHAEFGTTTEESWDASLDTNLKAPFFCAQAAAPMLTKSRGVIVNFADVGGILAWPGYVPHCVSKAGVIMLTRALAKTLAPEVRVNAIAPGTITMDGDPPAWESEYIQRAPLKRSGRPDDIADAVSYLIHAEFMTGQVLILDGGRTL
ncbi:MAG: SDR family NAD(P)-dependent oxidoreductase [Candidatus Acidiferrales bacterium]